ncbi:TIGR02677 family protein [Tomitella cavernea]|uniref:TIGR02677 family protein n=1 Tax=Tomitella cavernea TaxID=1387982 RepID=A0ABP9CUE1_9ACTN|nr:TIGR02677 family protein [Tomitella cavernea]
MDQADAPADTPRPFAHLQQPGAPLYRAIMGAFVQAKRRFIVHLRPEDIRAMLPDHGRTLGENHSIDGALASLEHWGNLRSDPDTSRVTSVEEFRRARYLYQMTDHGQAAEDALQTYEEALGRRGSLQSVALDDIAGRLRELHTLASSSAPEPGATHLALRTLVDRFEDLAANAQAFMSALARTIDVQDAEADAFVAYKERLIEYLERFIKDLVGTGAEIARLVEQIEDLGVDRLLRMAAERDTRDTAPGPAEAGDTADVALARSLALWRDRWQGFRAWFIGSAHHPSQAMVLRGQARSAIPRLLQVVSALHDRRSGRSDRAADFRALAQWFAEAPDDDAMHTLWRSAFGLQPSRHLGVDADTLEARAYDPIPPETPWADAPPLLISPRLRRTGSYERRGRPAQVLDRSLARRHLAERAAQEVRETARARARLATGGPVRLSDVGTLEPAEFRLFLGLLGDALAAKPLGARTVEVSTGDGAMAIRLSECDSTQRDATQRDGTGSDDTGSGETGPGAAMAEIRTPDGILRGPDHIVEIRDLSTALTDTALTDTALTDTALTDTAGPGDDDAPLPEYARRGV